MGRSIPGNVHVVMFVIDWNLASYLGKTYSARKCKKNGYQEFDHSGTLRDNCDISPEIIDIFTSEDMENTPLEARM